jgi:hypothetical protein
MFHSGCKNIKILVVLSTVTFLIVSCVNNYPKPPKQFYQEKEMVDLNVELLLANEWLSYYTGKNILGENEFTDSVFRKQVFENLKIDPTKYERSVQFYDKYPALQTRVFDSVYQIVDRMLSEESQLDSIMPDMDAEYKPEDFKKIRERYLNKK